MANQPPSAEECTVKILLRDISRDLVTRWGCQEAFGDAKFKDLVEISCGDIFEGAPAADAIVSPANSFGFMDGGIDMAYTRHFGWQMQERLQALLREKHYGELPVGQAVVIPAYPPDERLDKLALSPTKNQGQPIRFLVSAPTMRIPCDVHKTVNAYLAFRAVLIAVKEHNAANPGDAIRSVLCPGLGTAVGRMLYRKCAVQMRTAYDAVMFKSVAAFNRPEDLSECCSAHVDIMRAGDKPMFLSEVGPASGKQFVEER